MKRILTLLMALVIGVGIAMGAYRFIVHKKTSSFVNTLHHALGENSSFSYEKILASPQDNWVHVYGIKIKHDAQTFLIGEASFERMIPPKDITQLFLPILNLNQVEIISPSGSLTVKQLEMENLTLILSADHIAILGLTNENDISQKSLSFRAFGLHGYSSAMGAVVNSAGLAVITPPGALESSIKLMNFSFVSEIPPLHNIQLQSFVMDGVDIVDLYRQFTQNIPPPTRLGVQDMAIDFANIKEGSAPFVSADHFLTHTHKMEKSEQDLSVVRNITLQTQRPYLIWLNALGYQQFHGDILLNTTQIPQLQHLHVEAFSIDAPSLGHLTINGEFKMTPKHMAFMSLQPDMQVINMTIQYRDQGLVRRVISEFAGRAKLTDPLYLKKLHEAYRNNPWFEDFLHWVDNINTNRLVITTTPAGSFNLMQIFDSLNHLASSPYQAKLANMHISDEAD